MIDNTKNQDKLYRPTIFWEYGSNLIKEKYDETIEEFEKLVSDKIFVTRLQRLFNGYSSAFNDFKVLKASNICNPIEQVIFNDRKFSRSFLNYLLRLNFLKKHVNTSNITTTMEIAEGFGTLGEILLKDERNEVFYINVDIPVVQNYCNCIDKLEPQYIILINMQEGKRVQSDDFKSGVKKSILGDDYNTFLSNYQLVDSDSEIFSFVTVDGFHSQLRIYERDTINSLGNR